MTYIELINRFWDFYRVKKFSDIDTVIYFFLLNECNIRRWLNPFELQTRNLEVYLQISRKTIGEARNRLKQRGLIDFIEAQGRGPTTYFIDGADVTNGEIENAFCVSDCVSPQKHEGNTNGNTRVTQRLHKGNTTQDSTLYIEDIRHKNKDSIEKHSVSQPGLFSEKQLKKPKASKDPPPPFPTLEEVKRYFQSQDADMRLENWEESARRFFDNFNAVGWRDKFDRRIIRWDSRANNWICDEEKREKEIKSRDETKQADRFSQYGRTEPSSKSRKGFKGTFKP